ncbi:ABC transporter substrate-binding protein [Crossiella cryophila]|uniref:Multiple sugar transport system substrate-binding protein n=1 Tax=Crossiella cryophila TaxID=43355 RepID=A0A7W7FWQ9_9PSEU|nr:sugar ABC transporter substrate-binding protein [Crossiella cryophila]MBB4680557.1 multiple sugar transport system substrate-binding protein [Crossiella cryophila]
MRFRALAAAALAVSATALAGCSGNAGADGDTIQWWTWDDKQAAAYQQCVPGFEAANPGLKVKISQYAVEDYFTKITAGFVAGNAPDGFQNSVQFFQAYAAQHQLLPLDDLIKAGNFDLKKFSVGVDSWKFTDGKQYALPLDWAATGLYYNTDLLTKAGVDPKAVSDLDWNPDNGGSFERLVAKLSVDGKGVRGDQPGYDKNNVAVYGFGALAAKDFIGQTTWSSFVSTLGWRQGDTQSWPSTFNYTDPRFTKTMTWVRSLVDRGFAPKLGEFKSGTETDQLASGKVAMSTGGSWTAATFAKLPGIKVGLAPTVLGPDHKTRAVLSNSNGNVIWAGTKKAEATWKWLSHMGSLECQTTAGAGGSFFPSIPAAMDATARTMASQGVDLSVFTEAMKTGVLYPSVVYGNGAAIQSAVEPLFEAYFAGTRNEDVFAEMAQKSKDLLAKK